MRASSLYDLEKSFPDLWIRWKKLTTKIVHIPCKEDWRYPAKNMHRIHAKMKRIGVHTYYEKTSSKWGHGSYLYDPQSLKEVKKTMEKLLEEYE